MNDRETNQRDAEIAVERLTAWVRDYGDSKPQVFIGDVSMLLCLASAYLSEHKPDDDEPIDAEWLESVGFEVDRSESGYQLDGLYLCMVTGDITLHGQFIKPPRTRRDLRNLCKALGVEIQEVPTVEGRVE